MSKMNNKSEKRQYVYDYECPSITTDIIAMGVRKLPAVDWRHCARLQMMMLLVHRRPNSKAYPGYWALPGGFFRTKDKNIEACARRELKEETNLVAENLIPIGNFSEKGRDPRGWYVTFPYLAIVDMHDMPRINIKASDDVDDAEWFAVTQESDKDGVTITLEADSGVKFVMRVHCRRGEGLVQPDIKVDYEVGRLAFDHGEIIATALHGISGPGRRLRACAFLGDGFTMAEMRYVYDFMASNSSREGTIAQTFRRRMNKFVKDGIIEATGELSEGRGYHPAALYRWVAV